MNIRVNHAELRTVATEMDLYCDVQDREMNRANSAVISMLSSDWRGADAAAFGIKWTGVNNGDSVAVRHRDALRNYANALRICADMYERTQADVVNAAGLLMRLNGR